MAIMKFSIVTPVYNGEKYIAETIESVLSQKGDFEVEYFVQDGGSTDDTIEILKKYEKALVDNTRPIQCKGINFTWTSEKDCGMYDAIQKGFARATGDTLAWINADDTYLPGAFAAAANVFSFFPEIEWLKGINTTGDKNGKITSEGRCLLYNREWITKGIYGRSAYFIQQDSVFWRRSLWIKAQPSISSFRLAGDYALWITFAKLAPLWSFNKQVSMFRRRTGQLSSNMEEYRREQTAIAAHNFFLEKRVLLAFSFVRTFAIRTTHPLARAVFRLLFPFHKKWCYIDFDTNGNPIKKTAKSYIV
jgi:glycosyltransferase involved in cell wall biosynthesis